MQRNRTTIWAASGNPRQGQPACETASLAADDPDEQDYGSDGTAGAPGVEAERSGTVVGQGSERDAEHRPAPVNLEQQVHTLQAQAAALAERSAHTERQLSERLFELEFIRRHSSYRLASRLRQMRVWNAIRWLKTRNRGVVTIRVLGHENKDANGCDVWFLAARPTAEDPALPWDFVEKLGGAAWTRERYRQAPYGQFLKVTRGAVRFPLYGRDPVLTFRKHPRSGQIALQYNGRRRVIDLYAPEATDTDVFLNEVFADAAESGAQALVSPAATQARSTDVLKARISPLVLTGRYSDEEERWVEETRQHKVPVLAIYTPRWLGVSASTRSLFAHRYRFPRSADVEPYDIPQHEVQRQADIVAASGVQHVVCSGGDEIHYRLVVELKKRSPGVRCDLLWHSSYVQFVEDYTWRISKLWIAAAQAGVVHTIGTVKKGMEEFFRHLGCRSSFVMNYVPEVPIGPSFPDPGGPHLGIWMSGKSYLKLPYAMLAAAKMVRGSTIRGSNLIRRASEVMSFFELASYAATEEALPKDELADAIRKTHLSLYVTFSECSPMLPLESLSVGVPCIMGPTSHLFEDNEYLFERLVVPSPDRADVIARYIERALDERTAIVDEYRRYAPAYNARAVESVAEFLRG